MDYGVNVSIGRSTFINHNCKILDNPVRHVSIGERCLIGPNFSIYAIAHPVDFELRCSPAGVPSYGHYVTIGNDVWIGGHVTILGGVSIGDGCVIGANSLVTKDIPTYYLAYGSPARLIRRTKMANQQSLLSNWLTPLRASRSSSSRSRSMSMLNRLQYRLSALALGASICTALVAFVYVLAS